MLECVTDFCAFGFKHASKRKCEARARGSVGQAQCRDMQGPSASLAWLGELYGAYGEMVRCKGKAG